jgi:uncharacterized protein (DUF2252 family)
VKKTTTEDNGKGKDSTQRAQKESAKIRKEGRNGRGAAPTTASLRELGVQQRKVLPRVDLGKLHVDKRKRTALALLDESAHDRVAALVKLKNERMACSPFGFFRGAVPVMAYDLSLGPRTGIECQLCGDAHVQNLGAYAGLDGRLIFDINDFDETLRGPFEWDVKRMATSIQLAGDAAKVKPSCSKAAVELFLDAYCGMMHKFARMPVLEVARYLVHRLGSVAPVEKILTKAQHATPQLLLKQLTEETKDGRVFRTKPPVLRPVTGKEAKAVLDSLPEFAKSLLPERQRFFAKFRPVAVGFKVVGTGSVGLRDYCVLMEGNGPGDPLFLQIKQEVKSAYASYLPQHPAMPKNDGERVVEGQRAMQLQSDPLLGWTQIGEYSYLVRQLNDHKAAVDIVTLKPTGLEAYATVCGELLARGHARSGECREIDGYIGNGARFKEGIHAFAAGYAAQTVADWKLLVARQEKHSGKK